MIVFLRSTRKTTLILTISTLVVVSCGVARVPYDITRKSIETTYGLGKGLVRGALWTGKAVYRVGGFTFRVVTAPLTWPLTREEIQSIDDLPPKEAIRQGRVKRSPYVVNGRRYVPMSVTEASRYREKGTASWYGYETYRKKGGRMTANGEAFHPDGLNAAHRRLPLPTYVRVTNLENRRRIIVRVNDRGPFVDGRIIDLSSGAAKKLGFHQKGTALVLVETVQVDDGLPVSDREG